MSCFAADWYNKFCLFSVTMLYFLSFVLLLGETHAYTRANASI